MDLGFLFYFVLSFVFVCLFVCSSPVGEQMKLVQGKQSRALIFFYFPIFFYGLHFSFTVSMYWFTVVFVIKLLMQKSLKCALKPNYSFFFQLFGQYSILVQEFLSQGPCQQKRSNIKIYFPLVQSKASPLFMPAFPDSTWEVSDYILIIFVLLWEITHCLEHDSLCYLVLTLHCLLCKV